ncbi:hypothetical protein [Thermoleophilum album]|uniref:Uncharacterized protein n=1 Tax=Thermoleophilum album TaxID=29539 RepID=A0A1H6FLF7_THEAL|nr:hypothetical protein [Thermoleophilum album]SEH10655.1 hypothetical protein SAMN02745716_0502 [Thermoleophilum album]
MELFYVLGGAFAAWAVVIAAIGINRPSFPSSTGAQRLVIAASVLLAVAALASVVYASSTREQDGDQAHGAVHTVQAS